MPLLIQANAGVPELCAGQVHYPETPEFMAAIHTGALRQMVDMELGKRQGRTAN